MRQYEYRINGYVVPAIGGKWLRDLTMFDVEDLPDELARRPLA